MNKGWCILETELGRLLRDHRLSRGWSITDIGRYTNLSPVSLGKWERGEQIPRVQDCFEIARSFQIDPRLVFKLSLKEHVDVFVDRYQERWQSFKHTGRPRRGPRAFKPFKHRNDCLRRMPKVLRQARERKNLSVMELARRIGVSSFQIRDAENGRSKTSFHVIQRICDSVGVDAEKIVRLSMLDYIQIWTSDLKEYFELLLREQGTDFSMVENHTQMGSNRYPPIYATKTGDYLYDLRFRNGMTANFLGKLLSLSRGARPFEEGRSFLSFELILKIAAFTGDDIEDIFKMTLKDRIICFRRKHKEQFMAFMGDGNCDESLVRVQLASTTNRRVQAKPLYLASSNYLRKNRKKKGLSPHGLAKLIGLDGSSYCVYDRGQRSMSFLLVLGCSQLFGDDPYEVFDMVLEEKVGCASILYVQEWRAFKKEHHHEIDQLRSSDRQQVAQPV